MKVLYIGVLDKTGWGNAAQNYILALDSVGVDVVPRPVILGTPMSLLNNRMKELLDKSISSPDVVIQHILPHMMDYDGRIPINIGLYATETNDFSRSYWAECLNTMDRLIVPNHQMLSSASRSGVNRDIIVIPHASDIKRFEKKYAINPYIKTLKDQGKFVFYTVGELNRRKGLSNLIKAFHIEFSPEEPVELILKINGGGMSPEELNSEVRKSCEGIRPMMKLYSTPSAYKNEHIITQFMTDEELCSLHISCDCFVQPSYGEAWSYPAFDAMAFGKTPIVTDIGGYREYIAGRGEWGSGSTGWLVKAHEEPCLGYVETFEDQCSARDTWAAVDVLDLCRCMRQAYEREDLRKQKAEAGMARAYDFSYSCVGKRMKEVLLTCQKKNIGSQYGTRV